MLELYLVPAKSSGITSTPGETRPELRASWEGTHQGGWDPRIAAPICATTAGTADAGLAKRSSKMTRGTRMAAHRCHAPDFCRLTSSGGRREKKAHSPARQLEGAGPGRRLVVILNASHLQPRSIHTLEEKHGSFALACQVGQRALQSCLVLHLPPGFDTVVAVFRVML